MKEQKMTDEQLSQELNKSKGGRIGENFFRYWAEL